MEAVVNSSRASLGIKENVSRSHPDMIQSHNVYGSSPKVHRLRDQTHECALVTATELQHHSRKPIHVSPFLSLYPVSFALQRRGPRYGSEDPVGGSQIQIKFAKSSLPSLSAAASSSSD